MWEFSALRTTDSLERTGGRRNAHRTTERQLPEYGGADGGVLAGCLSAVWEVPAPDRTLRGQSADAHGPAGLRVAFNYVLHRFSLKPPVLEIFVVVFLRATG